MSDVSVKKREEEGDDEESFPSCPASDGIKEGIRRDGLMARNSV